MPVNNQELLIDHLDQTLEGQSLREAEVLIQSDSNAREEWEFLQVAVDAVQHEALTAQVAAIRAEMQGGAQTRTQTGVQTESGTQFQSGASTGRLAPATSTGTTAAPAQKAIVRRITRNIVRVAAAIVLLTGSLVIYKFATVSSSEFYNEHYTSYQLPTSRSNDAIDQLEQAFRNGNWAAVNTTYNNTPTKTNKAHFLGGMAALELKQFPQAIERFNQVLNNNASTGDLYFQDEAEYYLALAHIANSEAGKAMPLLKKIKADNNHPYRDMVNEMSGTDLKILELK